MAGGNRECRNDTRPESWTASKSPCAKTLRAGLVTKMGIKFKFSSCSDVADDMLSRSIVAVRLGRLAARHANA